MTTQPDIPDQSVTNAEVAIYQVLSRWALSSTGNWAGAEAIRSIASEAAVEALTASAPLIAAARQERITAVAKNAFDEIEIAHQRPGRKEPNLHRFLRNDARHLRTDDRPQHQ